MTAVTSDALLAEADLLLLLAHLLSPPVLDRGPSEAVDEADLAAVLTTCGVGAHIGELVAHACATHRAVPGTIRHQRYVSLFDGASPIPIAEAAWVRRDHGNVIGDIAGFLRAFHLRLAEGKGQRPDHLVCELELIALLLVMEANAVRDQRAEAAAVARDAVAAFVRDHLGVWIGPWCRATSKAEIEPFPAIAAALAASFDSIAARHRWILQPVEWEHAVPDADGPAPCDACPSAALDAEG